MSILSEPGHLAMPINFLAKGKTQMAQASFELGTSRFRVLRSAVAPHWLGDKPSVWHNAVPHTYLIQMYTLLGSDINKIRTKKYSKMHKNCTNYPDNYT